MRTQYQRGQQISVPLEKIVPPGNAFGRVPDGRPIFVKGGAPNEEALVELTKIKQDFLEARWIKALTPSAARVEPPFPAPALAGANWHYLSYPAQLEGKQAMLDDLLRKVGQLQAPIIQRIVGASELWRYRNKVELTFGLNEQGHVALGFHKPGRFDAIDPTDDSALFPEVIRDIISAFVSWAQREQVSVFNPRSHQGMLRNLVVRRAHHQPEFLVINLVTSKGELLTESLLHATEALPLSGLVWSQNESVATIVRIDAMRVLRGSSRLTERFLDVQIEYDVDSFFQTNTPMAEALAARVLEILDSLQPELVIDGYAGVGGFGLFAASRGANVVSIESHPASSHDAVTNAERFGIADKMTFINQPMEKYLRDDLQNSKIHLQNSVLIVDPPRAGLHPKALKAIGESGIKNVFYISCGPATLARDLQLLTTNYQLQPMLIQPFDLFPQTSHLETFVHLERTS